MDDVVRAILLTTIALCWSASVYGQSLLPQSQPRWEPVVEMSAEDSAEVQTFNELNLLTNTFVLLDLRAGERRRSRGLAQMVTGAATVATMLFSSHDPKGWMLASGAVMGISGVTDWIWAHSAEERLWRAWRPLPETTPDDRLEKVRLGKGRLFKASRRARSGRWAGGLIGIAMSPLAFVLLENRLYATLVASVSVGAGLWQLIHRSELEQEWNHFRWKLTDS